MKWISKEKELPEELVNDFHSRKLWVSTKSYGPMVGFFMAGKFWLNYAAEIKEVTHWILLPEPPEPLKKP